MDDVHAIRLAKTELREAYRTGDVDRLLSLFSDGLGDMTSDLLSFWGPEAKAVLKWRMKKLFARYRCKLAVTIATIRVQGGLAFDWGWHKLTLTPRKGGRPVTTRTRYLEIWVKEADEKWRIAVFLDNKDLPPRMPPREVLRAMGAGPSRRRPGRGVGRQTRRRRRASA
jgi:ketosteroid isomerase-like protein